MSLLRTQPVLSLIHIFMLSAKTQEMDKVTGLMLGADDYVTKPFSPSELLARVDSLYRRVAPVSYTHLDVYKRQYAHRITYLS